MRNNGLRGSQRPAGRQFRPAMRDFMSSQSNPLLYKMSGGNDAYRKLLTMLGFGVTAYGGYKLLDNKFKVGKDMSTVLTLVKVKRRAMNHLANGDTMADVWETSVDEFGDKACVWDDGTEFSFKQVDAIANRTAHWLLTKGLQPGDVVALYMHNCMEFLATWLGVLKAGGVCALVNFNVVGAPLKHSLGISNAKILILGDDLTDNIASLVADEDVHLQCYVFAGRNQAPSSKALTFAQNLVPVLAEAKSTRPSRTVRASVGFNDSALLVYTSGTTGLPKAATIRHIRAFLMGAAFVNLFKVTGEDRIYCVLPLYHSAGGLCGAGMMIQTGATLILKKKFSASTFWSDCRELNVTVVQYIGELCRYLLGTPKHSLDGVNKVRIAIGNGLRPDIWSEFQSRFNIPEIGEFYGSTEGNAALFNHCTRPDEQGAVGFLGPVLYAAAGLKLVKFDVVNEQPVRDSNGFCVKCDVNEIGELLGEIKAGDPTRSFAGYHGNKKATNSKVITNVFKQGDAYFRTGDLLRRDHRGYFYFMDRIGDTFRWKGENVSTTEVAEVVSVFPGLKEVNVYGAALPGYDGRACMAAVVLAESDVKSFDWSKLFSHVQQNLPSYSVPMFIRVLPEIDLTGTFKHKKVELRKQGANVSLIPNDPVLMVNARKKTYEILTMERYTELIKPKPRM